MSETFTEDLTPAQRQLTEGVEFPLELDRRETDGLTVSLLWRKRQDVLSVAVSDERTDEDFEFMVNREKALDAFHHPYAYIAGSLVVKDTFVPESAVA
ncbi:hypothetical protein KW794_01190 [Candidatus Saccharibacteria bacterium]|nr:hypothetical protein [Candidatus Saccharibacteria bacterium]